MRRTAVSPEVSDFSPSGVTIIIMPVCDFSFSIASLGSCSW